MYENNINDTRDMDEKFWNTFLETYENLHNLRELIENSDDFINFSFRH